MCGSMFAGHDECAGEITTSKDGEKYKIFYGMSSASAMNKYHGGVAKYRSAEGKTVKVPYKGPGLPINTFVNCSSRCFPVDWLINSEHRLKDLKYRHSSFSLHRKLRDIGFKSNSK